MKGAQKRFFTKRLDLRILLLRSRLHINVSKDSAIWSSNLHKKPHRLMISQTACQVIHDFSEAK